MTALKHPGPGEHAGSIVLRCDGEKCDERFTAGSFVTARTRIASERAGWTFAGRMDFCAECKEREA